MMDGIEMNGVVANQKSRERGLGPGREQDQDDQGALYAQNCTALRQAQHTRNPATRLGAAS